MKILFNKTKLPKKKNDVWGSNISHINKSINMNKQLKIKQKDKSIERKLKTETKIETKSITKSVSPKRIKSNQSEERSVKVIKFTVEPKILGFLRK